MTTIRKNVFETNSSSAHSLTFSTKGSLVKPIDSCQTRLDFVGGSYQWEWDTYCDYQSKFQYWLIAYTEWQSFILKQKNEAVKGVSSYHITGTPFISKLEDWGKTHGPSDIDVYKEVLKDTANHLKAVFDIFKEYNVSFTFSTADAEYLIDDTEGYIETFLNVNEPTTTEKLCNSQFDYLVDLGLGIDHQSGPRESEECMSLANSTPLEVVEWVLGDGYIETGNDNC